MTDPSASEANGHPNSSLITRAFLEEAARGFAIDTRALAAFRIAIGLLVLGDLLRRIPHLHTFYTDAGVLPRAVLREEVSILARVSLHAISGEPWVQALLFAVMALLAVGLTIGYRSRFVMAALCALYVSLYVRNPYVLYGGDGLLLIALLLGPFLPVGARWSIDAWGREAPPRQVLNLASATLLSQLVIIYTANAFFKSGGSRWLTGNAIQHVLYLEHYTVGLGPYLTGFPTVLHALTWLLIGLQLGACLLILTIGHARAVLVAGYAGFHLGMLATMRLGLFPLLVIALLILYVPSTYWDRFDPVVASLVDRISPMPHRSTPFVRRPELPGRLRQWGATAASVLLIAILITSLAWPAGALGMPGADRVNDAEEYPMKLFAPNPPALSEWFILSADTPDGAQLNPLDGSELARSDPNQATTTHRGNLWQQYLDKARTESDDLRQAFGAYLCRQAHANSDRTISSVSVDRRTAPTPVVNRSGGERRLFVYECR